MAKKRNERLGDTVETLRPYIERALKDDEFRGNVREAVDAARGVYGDLSKANGLTKSATKLATDKDVHGNLQRALAELTDAVERVQGTKGGKRRKKRKALLMAGVVAGAPSTTRGRGRARATGCSTRSPARTISRHLDIDTPRASAAETNGASRFHRRRRDQELRATASEPGELAGGDAGELLPERTAECARDKAARAEISDDCKRTSARRRRSHPREAVCVDGECPPVRERRVLGAPPRDEERVGRDHAVVAERLQSGRMDLEVEMRRAEFRVAALPHEADHVTGVDVLALDGERRVGGEVRVVELVAQLVA